MSESIADFLQQIPLFQGLTASQQVDVAQDFRLRHYRKGEIIFHQGDVGHSLYLVQVGKVRIYHMLPNGEETTVVILGRRQITGEFAVLDELPRSAVAQSLTHTTLLEMHKDQFLYHLENIPGLALALCRMVVGKTRLTSMYAETIARLDAAGRLLQLIIMYNQEMGEPQEDGKRYLIDLGLNQADLATMIGTSRGWINRILQEWRRRDLIHFDGGRILILDLPALIEERNSRIV